MALDPAMLRSALARTIRPVAPDVALAEFGGGTRGRVALAQAIAGTTDKKSRAYKNAMRNLQRYGAAEGKQQRSMGAKLRPQITRAVQIHRAAAKLKGPITVRWIGPVIRISSDTRQRLDFDAELSEADLAEVRDLLEEGDDEGAIDALAAASLASYLADSSADGTLDAAAGLRITWR